MATMMEAKPFVLGMSMQIMAEIPFRVFKSHDHILIVSGVGKVNAALAAVFCHSEFAPACMVNLGAAGASDFSHPLGETFHINKIIETDRMDITTGKRAVHHPDILDGFPFATLSTSDQPVILPEARKDVSKIVNLMDMEAAGFVQASRMCHIPSYVFKFVSDTPAHTGDGDIIENIRVYRTRFYESFQNHIMPVVYESLK